MNNEDVKKVVDKYEMPQRKKKKKKSSAFSYLKTIIIAVAISFVMVFFVIISAVVPTGSMKNTILENDRVIGFRLAYLTSTPKRGDIIIFKYPDDPSIKFIKRVIGLPGDKVNFKNGDVYINDEKLDEPYLLQKNSTFSSVPEYIVPENSYFMLGDNRLNSKDSRFWKHTFVTKNEIIGKALFKYFNQSTHKIDFKMLS